MRVDAHQHFWRIADGRCRWLTPDLSPIYRDFGPDDLRPLLRRRNISATVLVQAADCDAETDWLLEVATESSTKSGTESSTKATPGEGLGEGVGSGTESESSTKATESETEAGRVGVGAGVVGWADFASDSAPSRLRELAERSGLVGVRPMIQDIPDAGWMLRPELTPAFRAVTECGLAFDALVLPKHLDNLSVLLSRFPEMKVVVDHGAKPALRDGASGMREWVPGIRRIAKHPGAHCKFSGLLTEARPGAAAGDLRECAEVLLDAFGPERLMWGSDWPVLNLASDYEKWLDITEELLSSLSESERAKVLGETAVRFYNLRFPGAE